MGHPEQTGPAHLVESFERSKRGSEQPAGMPGSSPEISTARSRLIARTRSLLTGINGYERYAQRRGEVDDEEWHHHQAAKKQVLEAMHQLSPVDQEILEAVFPTDGSPAADLEDETTRESLADTFGVARPGEFHREADLALERLGHVLYGKPSEPEPTA